MAGDDSGRWVERIDSRLPELYLVVALAVGVLLCWVTAPFFGPDEPNQALRAISVGHGEMVLHAQGDDAGDAVDDNVTQVMAAMDALRMSWETTGRDFHDRPYGPMAGAERQRVLAEQSEAMWGRGTAFLGFSNTAGYPPFLYAPASVGWRVGEAMRWTVVGSLRLARLLCALMAVGLGWVALRIGVGVRWRLLAFLLLPSVLFLNACCSEDAVMLPVAAVVAALTMRAVGERRGFLWGEMVAVTGLVALCGMARPPYVAMGLVLFLPGLEAGERRWRGSVAGFGVVVAACGVWRWLVRGIGVDTSDLADPELQKMFLREHPVAGGWALARGTAEAGWDFVHRGLYVVGWNDLLPHHGAAAVLAVCLVAVMAFAPGVRLGWKGWGLVAVAVVAPLVGISAAEYLIWTPPGLHTVYGVQPRYWLPVMPLAMMLGSGQVLRRWRRVGAVGAIGIAVVACTLPMMAAHAFYRETVWRVLGMVWR